MRIHSQLSNGNQLTEQTSQLYLHVLLPGLESRLWGHVPSGVDVCGTSVSRWFSQSSKNQTAAASGEVVRREHWPTLLPVCDFRWVVYQEPNYRGPHYILEKRDYNSFSDWGSQNNTVGSMRRIRFNWTPRPPLIRVPSPHTYQNCQFHALILVINCKKKEDVCVYLTECE